MVIPSADDRKILLHRHAHCGAGRSVSVGCGKARWMALLECDAGWRHDDHFQRRKGMSEEKKPEHQISIQIDPQAASGVYSNLMMISHRKEEFILDFLFVQPQKSPDGPSLANLRSRVIATPEHARRILRALEENIRRYEKNFGTIAKSAF